ncbi:MAG TPA: DUF4411 family protein [Opitutaceae bacterium]|nr:DUF4411 family protein [Opitutaceae bacterium]
MPATPPIVLDSNVLIQAHRGHYGFAICPGFWDWILHYQPHGRVISLDVVRDEINDGSKPDDLLTDWANNKAPKVFWAPSKTAPIIAEYQKIIEWVQKGPRGYTADALKVFAAKADGWVLAYAKVNGCVVATHETEEPKINGRVKIPCAGRAFGITCVNPFDMLKAFPVKFDWKPPA